MKRKYSLNQKVFNEISGEEQAYWLGFILADGNIYRNPDRYQHLLQVGLSIKDVDHLEKFRKFLGTNIPIKIDKNKTKCSLQIQSKEILTSLSGLGVVEQKTFSQTLPSINKDLRKHLIRGLVDGDGSIGMVVPDKRYPDYKRPNFSFCGNKYIVNSVYEELHEELQLTNTKNIKHSKSNIFYIRKSSSPAKIIVRYLYENANVYLDRKYELSKEILSWKPTKKLGGKSYVV